MNEELYKLIALSNRNDLNEIDALFLLRKATALIGEKVKKAYQLASHDTLKTNIAVSFNSLKLLYETLSQIIQQIETHQKIEVEFREFKIPQWETIDEDNHRQIVALLESCHEIFNFMNDAIETHLTMQSFTYPIKRNLDDQLKLIGLIVMSIDKNDSSLV